MNQNKRYNWKRNWLPRGSRTNAMDSYWGLPYSNYTIDNLTQIPCLVLLGEPGIGKSQALRDERDALNTVLGNDELLFLDLRSFGDEVRLSRKLFESSTFQNWIGGENRLYLFLDSLDECLLQIKTVSKMLVDELQEYSDAKARLFLRITCRTADWPSSLEESLIRLWGNESTRVLELAPLNNEDVIEAARVNELDSGKFLSEIARKEVIPLSRNPITLNFLLNSYGKSGQFPKTKTEIYLEGCRWLCEEPNPGRRDAKQTGSLTTEQRIAVAARIAAITIFSNRYAVGTDIESRDLPDEIIAVNDLCGGQEIANESPFKIDQVVIRETLSTGLLSARGSHLLGWAHQTYAEFLAAYYVAENMSVDQIRSMLFLSDGKLVPQLHQVASWIASFVKEIFWQVMEAQPEILLSSAISTADNAGKALLTKSLLQLYDDGTLLAYSYFHLYSKLLHPGLDGQLRQYILDINKSINARRAAINIAEVCELQTLQNELLHVALDTIQPLKVRIDAVGAIGIIGDEQTKAKLKPLAMVEDQDDVANDLKYEALKIVWPLYMTAEELFSGLTSSNKDDILMLQRTYLPNVVKELKTQDLPIALCWVSKLPRQYFLPLSYTEMMDSIMFQAWEKLGEPQVLEAFVEAIFGRLSKHDAVIGEGFYGEGHSEFASEIKSNKEKRRKLLYSILPSVTNPDAVSQLVYSAPPLAYNEDFQWLIDWLKREQNKDTQLTIAKLIGNIVDRHDSDQIEVLFEACQSNPMLDKTLGFPFTSIELNSAQAETLRSHYLERKKWQEKRDDPPLLDPPPEGQIALMLERCEVDDSSWWVQLTSALLLTPQSRRFHNNLHPDLMGCPGWQNSDEQIRIRITTAAKQFVLNNAPKNNDWLETNKFPFSALAGYQALRLLLARERGFFLSIPTRVWSQWIPSIFRYPNESGEPQQLLLLISYLLVPDKFIEILMFLLEQEAQRGSVYVLNKITRCWDEKLIGILEEKLEDEQLNIEALSSLLSHLIQQKSERAVAYAQSLISQPGPDNDKRERAIIAASMLITKTEAFEWSLIWDKFQTDPEFGKNVIERIVRNVRHGGWADQNLTEIDLSDLYIWLAHNFSPSEDPERETGWNKITIRHAIAEWRDSILYRNLAERGTEQACKEIERIVNTFPKLGVDAKRLLYYAQDKLRRNTWRPLRSKEILKLIKNPKISLVQSEDELLKVVLESLGKLQKKLFGETPSLRDIWDKTRPIGENDFSDYVKRHLDEDIAKRGIVANREVQIRRGAERTDIHINAIIPNKHQETHDVVTLIIEVKGCWHPELMKAMETQLLNRYLKDNRCTHGLYLVGWFNCEKWDDDDGRKRRAPKMSLHVARKKFNDQADSLSANENKIAAFVLDAGWK